MDWWYIAVPLLVVGFLLGILVARAWKGGQVEQPRIRRNRLVWHIFQWLVFALGVAIVALILAAWTFIRLEEGASEFI